MNHLQQLLKRLEEKCLLDEDGKLNCGDIRKLLPISSIKETTTRLHGIQSVLHTLLDATEDAIRDLELQSKARHPDINMPSSRPKANILSIPEEVSRMTLEYLDQVDNRAASRFSLTCRKFRKIALSLPEVWTRITNETMKIPQCEAYLTRSRSLPLTVEIVLKQCFRPSLAQQFVLTVLQHAHRIKAFSVQSRAKDSDKDERDFLAWLKRDAFKGELPLLDSLSIGFNAVPKDGNSGRDLHFAESWSMPLLQAFSASNFFPHGRMPITSLGVKYDYSSARGASFDTAGLLSFLNSNPQLQKLSLDFNDSKFEDYWGSPVVMENVETLNVAWNTYTRDYTSLDDIMMYLKFPNLVTMKATVERLDEWDDVGPWLSVLFGGQRTFNKLVDFTLIIQKAYLGDCGMRTIFDHAPNLKNLSIEALDKSDGVRLWNSGGYRMPESPTPSLETVQLKLGGHFRADTVAVLLRSAEVRRLEFSHSSSHLRSDVDGSLYETEVIRKEKN